MLIQEDLDPGLDGHDFPAVKAAGNLNHATFQVDYHVAGNSLHFVTQSPITLSPYTTAQTPL